MSIVSLLRPALGEPKAVFVLMHGLGSDERDMFGLAQELHPDVEVVCLRAPLRYGPGHAWFDIQWTGEGIIVNPDEVWRSVNAVANFVSTLPRENLVVGGFSQGAMMTHGLMHRYSEHFEHAVLLSGRGVSAETPAFFGKVFQAHGTYDEVIGVHEAHSLRDSLQPLSDRFEYHEYEMGHSVSYQEIVDLNQWFASL